MILASFYHSVALLLGNEKAVLTLNSDIKSWGHPFFLQSLNSMGDSLPSQLWGTKHSSGPPLLSTCSCLCAKASPGIPERPPQSGPWDGHGVSGTGSTPSKGPSHLSRRIGEVSLHVLHIAPSVCPSWHSGSFVLGCLPRWLAGDLAGCF